MRRIWRDLRSHRRMARAGLVVWLAVWAFTALTWLYKEDGQPLGMHPVAIVLQMLTPVIAGGVAWWWGRGPISLRPRGLALATFFAVVTVALFGRPLPIGGPTELLALALTALSVIYSVRGLGIAAVAGLLVLEIDIAVLFLFDAILAATRYASALGETQPMNPLVELVEWGTLMGGLGIILGWLGGLIAELLARGTGRSRPGPAVTARST